MDEVVVDRFRRRVRSWVVTLAGIVAVVFVACVQDMVPKPENPDAGAIGSNDAGAVEGDAAPAPDATPPDAGLDATPADAGAADAGAPDATP